MANSIVVPAYPARSRAAHVVAWILQVLLALSFLGAGGAKLAGMPAMIAEFETIGLGQGFRYVTAAIEIVGGIALLAPRVTALGGLLMAATMVGATVAQLLRIHNTVLPALVLIVLSLLVAFLRRDQLPRVSPSRR